MFLAFFELGLEGYRFLGLLAFFFAGFLAFFLTFFALASLPA